jgi:hypothetical protein
MVSSLIGDTLSAIPSSSSSSIESFVAPRAPKVQVLDATGFPMRSGTSHPQDAESHRIQYQTRPVQHFSIVGRSVSSVPSPPPVTPSPSSPTQAPYRFETPAYVFAPPTSNVLEQLKSSAGCTCKKSRYVSCMFSSFTTSINVANVSHFSMLSQLPQTLLPMLRFFDDMRPKVPLRRMSQYHSTCGEH